MRKSGRSLSLALLVLVPAVCSLLSLLSLAARAAEERFPLPEVLKPAVDFWVRVYTEVDTSGGYLHDAENLSVIYAELPRERQGIEQRREQIVRDLKVLASGRRTQLSEGQRHILALWPEDVSNERLARAAGNVRWQLGQRDRFLAGLRRSGAYRRYIEEVIQDKGLPPELAILPHVESSFHPGAYSSAAATGMWQFIRATAQRFMQVDHIVDERLDPYAATHAAMELLEYNYNALGTWPLALTAYNHGANGMARAVKTMGSTDIGRIVSDYRGSRFGFASRNFYAQFLAALAVDRHARDYFGEVEYDPYPEFTELALPGYVDANTLAEQLGLNLDLLRRFNPALQPAVWSGTKRIPRGYRLKLDRHQAGLDLSEAFAALPSSLLHDEQIPDLSYVVSRGDSLSLIAARYNTSVRELVAINQLRDRHRIRVGQELLLPQGVQAAVLAQAEGPATVPADGKYVVRAGDTLSVIAARFSVSEDALLSINGLGNRDLIHPGQTLQLVGETAPVAADPVVVAAVERIEDELASPMDSMDPMDAVEEGPVAVGPQLARLSLDSDNRAVAVDEAIAAAEVQEQLLDDLASDPSDYSVAADHSIEIQASETLGHFADWLGIRAWDLRRLNGMAYGDPVIIGDRLKLDFSQIDSGTFETRRRAYHRDIQANYFEQWRIKGTEHYQVKSRDLLVRVLAARDIPLWLFRQYNPDVNSRRIQIGQELVIPVVEAVEG